MANVHCFAELKTTFRVPLKPVGILSKWLTWKPVSGLGCLVIFCHLGFFFFFEIT